MTFVKKLLLLFSTVSFFALVSFDIWAWPPEVAPEWEFTGRWLIAGWEKQSHDGDTENKLSLRQQELFREEVERRCPGCEFEELKDKHGARKFRVHVDKDFYFEITLDPAIIEIPAQPLRVDKIAKYETQLDDLLWGIAKKLGLRIDDTAHLNFGVESTFGDDALLFYNFITDYWNHPTLAEGVLGLFDPKNAPHPERLNQRQRANLKKILDDFQPKKSTIPSLAEKIIEKVYYKSTVWGEKGDGELAAKFHALGLLSIISKTDSWPRLEIRPVPMHKNMKEFQLLVDLFVKRIEYLKTLNTKIEYDPSQFKKTRTRFAKVKQFYEYVTESGADWRNYRRFIPKHMSTALKRIEKSVGFDQLVRAAKSCTWIQIKLSQLRPLRQAQ